MEGQEGRTRGEEEEAEGRIRGGERWRGSGGGEEVTDVKNR